MGRRSRVNLIREALMSGPKRWTDLLTQTKLSKATLYENLRKMAKNGEVIHDDQSHIYRLTGKGRVIYFKTAAAALREIADRQANVIQMWQQQTEKINALAGALAALTQPVIQASEAITRPIREASQAYEAATRPIREVQEWMEKISEGIRQLSALSEEIEEAIKTGKLDPSVRDLPLQDAIRKLQQLKAQSK